MAEAKYTLKEIEALETKIIFSKTKLHSAVLSTFKRYVSEGASTPPNRRFVVDTRIPFDQSEYVELSPEGTSVSIYKSLHDPISLHQDYYVEMDTKHLMPFIKYWEQGPGFSMTGHFCTDKKGIEDFMSKFARGEIKYHEFNTAPSKNWSTHPDSNRQSNEEIVFDLGLALGEGGYHSHLRNIALTKERGIPWDEVDSKFVQECRSILLGRIKIEDPDAYEYLSNM